MIQIYFVIENLFKKHKHWVNLVRKFGGGYYSEDIVQEAYIKVYGKKINEGYFYLTLRSITMDLHRKKVDTFDIDDIDIKDEPYQEPQCVEKYKEVLSTFDWYDRILFLLYANSGMSMRKIARETHISFMSIYNTIKKCKEKLKNQKD